jgi:hypothetical protein
MSFLGSMMGGLAGRAAVPLVGVAGLGAYKSGSLEQFGLPAMSAPAHFEMQARVTSVEEACRLRYRDDGKLRQTKALPCHRAVALLRQADFVGYTIHKSVETKYTYYALDGKSTYTGVLVAEPGPVGPNYRKNDVINIRIDAKDPTRSEVI